MRRSIIPPVTMTSLSRAGRLGRPCAPRADPEAWTVRPFQRSPAPPRGDTAAERLILGRLLETLQELEGWIREDLPGAVQAALAIRARLASLTRRDRGRSL